MTTNYVIGAPGTGKSTYVAKHRVPNELVLDFDAIAYALGSDTTDHHTKPHTNLITEITKTAWFPLFQQIERQGKAGHNVWIIHAIPSAKALTQYYRRGTVHNMNNNGAHHNAKY